MGLMAALAAAGMMGAGGLVTTIERQPGLAPDLDHFPKNKRGKGLNNRRGKGKRSPPRSRPNRLTISKRVRRKHRRQS